MKKIQDYTLLLITIILIISGFALTFHGSDEELPLGIIFLVFGGLFLLALLNKRFVDVILFFNALGGLSFGLVLLFAEDYPEGSSALITPSIFILFILWKDNFFVKEPIKKTDVEISDKNKSMLDELIEISSDHSTVGKSSVKQKMRVTEDDNQQSQEV